MGKGLETKNSLLCLILPVKLHAEGIHLWQSKYYKSMHCCMNVRILLDINPNVPGRKTGLIARKLHRLGIDIAALQEMCLAGEGDSKRKKETTPSFGKLLKKDSQEDKAWDSQSKTVWLANLWNCPKASIKDLFPFIFNRMLSARHLIHCQCPHARCLQVSQRIVLCHTQQPPLMHSRR